MADHARQAVVVGVVLLTLTGCGVRTNREVYIPDPLALRDPPGGAGQLRDERLMHTLACSYFWPHRLTVWHYRILGTNDNYCPPILWFWEESDYPWDSEHGE